MQGNVGQDLEEGTQRWESLRQSGQEGVCRPGQMRQGQAGGQATPAIPPGARYCTPQERVKKSTPETGKKNKQTTTYLPGDSSVTPR